MLMPGHEKEWLPPLSVTYFKPFTSELIGIIH
jgi:hypothetical protein